MYVCLCKSVSDRTIRQAVEEGARSWREVRERTGCGTQCGKCACMGKSITNDAVARQIVPDADFAYAV
ncbi:bacterioferritin-associated ferredoxin [Modicisalibacter muralis]|uniref:Bacterioferritin-associated ferredoxin n=1 Tax=Modicisalibacter muralis TaxID=119000 RepID=A0A1G9IIK1_9GAMM|nr:(2Fe-2S)-binding protein [Halomonas muralis]SDL25099.1 bacterioferritin-associated ferredoxin [Halomonas muralis]